MLWRDRGSRLDCQLTSHDHPVRCRARGIARVRNEAITLDRLDVIIEGFAPATGETTWSVPAGRAESLINHQRSLAIAGPTQVVIDRRTGPILLDYATGSVSAPPPGATFWCMRRVHYDILPGYTVQSGAWHYAREGGRIATSCDARGLPSQGLPSAEATIAAGAHTGDHAVIAGPHGYVGFQLR